MVIIVEFKDVKEIIKYGLNLTNCELYEKFYGLDIVPVKGFFDQELDRVEKQLVEDVLISNVNVNYIKNSIFSFLQQIHNVLTNFKHDNEFRRFAEAIILFLSNWVKILDKNKDQLMELKEQIDNYINMISNDLAMWYSLFDLVLEANKQIDTLRKWNSFRPAGFEVAPHMFSILTEQKQDGDNCGCK